MRDFIKAYPRHTVFIDSAIILGAFKDYLAGDFFDEDRIREFEGAFAKRIGVGEAVAVSSGRKAFFLILKAFNFPRGSEIILSDYNFPPIVSVIVANGLRPVFIDVDPTTFNLDTAKIERRISANTRAILVTHAFGNPCDMDAILKLASKFGLKVIEDCAQAFGSRWKGSSVGSLSDAAFFSLSIGKNIVTFGGGMAVTSDVSIVKIIRSYRDSLKKRNTRHILKEIISTAGSYYFTRRPFFNLSIYPLLRFPGYFFWNIIENNSIESCNKALDFNDSNTYLSLQAKAGLSQLSRGRDYEARKTMISSQLDKNLSNIESLIPQKALVGSSNIRLYHALRLKGASRPTALKLRKRLLSRGVDTQSPDMHACSTISQFSEHRADCPISAELANTVFEIPSDVTLKEKDLNQIVAAIKECVCE